MKKTFKNIIFSTLIVSLVAGSTFFISPAKAEAGVIDCIAGMVISKTKSKTTITTAVTAATARINAALAQAQLGRATSVPTFDAGVITLVKANAEAVAGLVTADANVNSGTDSQSAGLAIKRCIIEPLVTLLARTILDKFTAQTVNWINSGFQGSPQFVTNIQGFMSDVADQAIGSYIEGLGPIGSILCGPFDLQVRLSLNLQYSKSPNLYERVGCRLSDIQKNVQGAFTKGHFGQKGWDNWLQLTQNPQNNPYGAYLKAVDSIDLKIAGMQGSLKSQLDFGNGFLSVVDKKTGKITTPGTIVESQLNSVLAQPLQNLGLAQDLDAILGALVNQMIGQVMGGIGGLAGASDSRSASGGYSSAVDRGMKTTPESVVSQNGSSQNLRTGLIMNTSTGTVGPTVADTINPTTGEPVPNPISDAFCAQFKQNVYGTSPGDPSGDVYVQINGTTNKNATPVKTSKSNGAAWNIDDYRAAANYCQYAGLTGESNKQVVDFLNQSEITGVIGDDLGAGDPTPIVDRPAVEKNLALSTSGGVATQSSEFDTCTAAIRAIDRNTGGGHNCDNGNTFASAFTKEGAIPAWWQVQLGKLSSIKKINIYRYTGDTAQESLGNLTVEIYSGNALVFSTGPVYQFNGDIPYVVTPPAPVVGDRVLITRKKMNGITENDFKLGLAEVEVIGTEGEIAKNTTYELSDGAKAELKSRGSLETVLTIASLPETLTNLFVKFTLKKGNQAVKAPALFSLIHLNNPGYHQDHWGPGEGNIDSSVFTGRVLPGPFLQGTKVEYSIYGKIISTPEPGNYTLVAELFSGSGQPLTANTRITTQTTPFTIQ